MKTIFQLNNEKKCIKEKLNDYELALKEVNKLEVSEAVFNNFINKMTEYKEKLKNINKQINRINNYKVVKINSESDVETSTLKITFPKNTKKSFIYSWLEYNELPTHNIHRGTGCGRDCTGEVYKIDIEVKNSIVTIVKYYDV